MRKRRLWTGFTLIEVLVVVAIIAVLIAILLPALARAREQTRTVLCRAGMKQIITGMLLYVQDYKRFPATQSTFYENFRPPSTSARCWGFQSGKPTGKMGYTWEGATCGGGYSPTLPIEKCVPRRGTIFKYVKETKLYVCASSHPGPAASNDLIGESSNGFLDYSMNAYMGYLRPDDLVSFAYVATSPSCTCPDGTTRVRSRGQRAGWAGGSSMKVLFEEHPFHGINNPAAGYGEGNFNTAVDWISVRHSLITGASGTRPAVGRTNIAFADGRVDTQIYQAATTAESLFCEMGEPSPNWGANFTAFKYVFKKPSDCPN